MPAWADTIFTDHAEIYLPVLEHGLRFAPPEVRGLSRVLRRYGVPSRSTVLDLCCGIGRHGIFLAKRGFRVVGYDPSAPFLRRAEELRAVHGLTSRQLCFYQGKFRDAAAVLRRNGEGPFQAIITMDGSFGYGSRREDLAVFRELRPLCSTNAVLVAEVHPSDFWDRTPARSRVESFDGGLVRETKVRYDSRRRVLNAEWRFFRVNPRRRELAPLLTVNVPAHLYSREELRLLLVRAGWRYLRSFQDMRELQRFTVRSPNLVILTRRSLMP